VDGSQTKKTFLVWLQYSLQVPVEI